MLAKLFSKKTSKKPGRVCVSLLPERIQLVHSVPADDDLPGLQCCEVVELKQAEQALSQLKQLVQTHGLTGVDSSLLLLPGQYRLLMLEAPNVPLAEREEAMRWQIRDLIDFPVEQAAIAVFDCPQAISDRSMVFVAVLKRTELKAKVKILQQAGLVVDVVDIFELSLRNLLHTYEPEDEGIGLVYLQEKQSTLVICRRGELLVARQLSVPLEALRSFELDELESMHAESPVAALVLELQRSLDYFESQMRGGRLEQLLLFVDSESRVELAQHLSQQLTTKLQCLDCARLLRFETETDYVSLGLTLPNIGGAQRTHATS